MLKRILSLLNILFVAIGLLLAACSLPDSNPVPQPPASPVATTGSITPPQTGVRDETGGGSAIAKIILTGMRRARSATKFHLEEQITGKRGLERLYFLEPGDDQQYALIHSLTLECNGADCSAHVGGGSASLFGVSPNRGVDSKTVGGDGYVHGPLPLLKLTEDRWYRLPGQPGLFAVSVLSSTELYGYVDNGAYTGAEIEDRLATFVRAGQEALDGFECDIYAAADKEVTLAALRAKIGGNLMISDVTSFAGDGETEFKIWICADGYFHQMRLGFIGHDNTRPDVVVERRYLLHIFRFNEEIVIASPAEAIPVTPAPN